jgi:hypothetical protein
MRPKVNLDVDEAPNDPGEERTGEEDDDILFNEKAQLCVLVHPEGDQPGRYVEKAIGPLHFNRCQNCYRLVMRHSDGRRPMLNLRVFEKMQPKIVGGKENESTFWDNWMDPLSFKYSPSDSKQMRRHSSISGRRRLKKSKAATKLSQRR